MLGNTHSHKKVEQSKPTAPQVVVALKAGLHPASKTVATLATSHTKKPS